MESTYCMRKTLIHTRRLLAKVARKQRATPVSYVMKKEQHQCLNCNWEYEGNFCPCCGQESNVQRITWRSVGQNILSIWGMSGRTLPHTLLMLLWRPGYLISDYLEGKRKSSFPPIQMLFLICLLGIGLRMILPIQIAPTSILSVENGGEVIWNHFENMRQWAERNNAWAQLIFQILFIPAMQLFFRNAPRHRRTTLPENFFIQVFIGCLFQWVSILWMLFTLSYVIGSIYLFPEWLVFFLLFYTYYQLYGYGFWQTLWRTFIVAISPFLWLLLAIIAYILIIYG